MIIPGISYTTFRILFTKIPDGVFVKYIRSAAPMATGGKAIGMFKIDSIMFFPLMFSRDRAYAAGKPISNASSVEVVEVVTERKTANRISGESKEDTIARGSVNMNIERTIEAAKNSRRKRLSVVIALKTKFSNCSRSVWCMYFCLLKSREIPVFSPYLFNFL